MNLVGLLILCIVIGAGLYLLDLVPIDATIKRVIRVVVILILVIIVILFLAQMLGLGTGTTSLRLR
jgi:hypothetical protein